MPDDLLLDVLEKIRQANCPRCGVGVLDRLGGPVEKVASPVQMGAGWYSRKIEYTCDKCALLISSRVTIPWSKKDEKTN